ncbi:MAG: SdrD B-like domain-containing protein [Phycisphaerae bacterium]
MTDQTGTLLTGEIAKFGYLYQSSTHAKFDFVFHPTGGSLLTSFAGQDIGVVMTPDKSTFLAVNSFQSDFFTDVKGFAGPIPGGGSPPPVITTQAGAPVVIGSGNKLTDTATLSGGVNPTGTITFTLTGPGNTIVDTETVAANGDGVYTTPTGFLPTVTGSYKWSATFTSSTDSSTATDDGTNETELVTPNQPNITTVAGSSVVIGSGDKLTDTAFLVAYNPTGTITFTLTGPGGTVVDTETVPVNPAGNGTYTTPTGYTPITVGTYTWSATYNGDGNNLTATDDGQNESEVVKPASPAINTVAGSAVVVGSGDKLTDTATLSGGFNPTGTITFTLTGPANTVVDTETVPVNGNGPYSTPAGFVPTVVGTYTWSATYNGDGNNLTATDDGQNESETVNKANPSISTNALFVTNSTVGNQIQDSATIIGAFNGSGTITFTVTKPDGTTASVGTATVNGNGIYFSPAFATAAVGTYTFHASYSGDSLNNGALDNGANESLTTTKASPAIATVASANGTTVGSAVLSDKVIVSGGLNPSGVIAFTVTRPDGTTATVGNITISGDGTYNSPTITATQVGTYTFHANYAGDSLNNGAVDNGANESITTNQTTPSLITTAIVTTSTSNCTNNTYNCGSYKNCGSYTIGCGGYTIDCSKNYYNWCGGPVCNTGGSGGGNITIAVTHDTAVLSNGYNETGTITFTLTDQNGNVLDTENVSVNGNGNYTTSNFTINNPAGTYTWSAVYSGDTLNASAHDQGGVNEQFSFNNGGTISGHKFLDLSGNGLSGDDTGLGNVTIQLYNDKDGDGNIDSYYDKVIATTTTDASGAYSFTGLAAGHYIVKEVNPSGYLQTGPVSGQYAINLTSNGTSSGNDFDDFKLEDCVISCIKYEINGCKTVSDISGQLHQGDVVKVTFTIPSAETISFVSYTAPDSYFVADHASQQKIFDQDIGVYTHAGTYSLTIVVPNCDYQVDFVCGLPIDKLGPAGSNIFYTPQGRLHDSDNGGTDCKPPVIGSCNGSGSIAGTCFGDNNKNGKKDSGECGIGGTKVTCYGNTNDGKCIILTTYCDSNGNYKFNNLPAGCYKVVEHTPNQCYDGADSVGSCGGTRNDDVCSNIVLGNGKCGTGYNFGELVTSSISGTVYGDKDKDGTIDAAECGIAGVKITLSGTNDLGQAVSFVTYTDQDGNYSFEGLRAGTYTLIETQPSGYTTTRNTLGTNGGVLSGDSIKSISLGWSTDASGYNFGDATSASSSWSWGWGWGW